MIMIIIFSIYFIKILTRVTYEYVVFYFHAIIFCDGYLTLLSSILT